MTADVTTRIVPARRPRLAHQTRAQYERNLAEIARAAFATHEITDEDDVSWTIRGRAPDGRVTNNHCAQIVGLDWGVLLIHGDVETVVFNRCSGGMTAEIVRSIGGRPADYHSLTSKARYGCGAAAETRDDRVARGDLLRKVKNLREVGASRTDLEPYLQALACLRNGDAVEMVQHELWSAADVDTEWLGRLGLVPDRRVFYAYAACARLVSLLDARTTTATAAQESP